MLSLPIVQTPMAFCRPPERRVVFVGDPGIGRSSLVAVSMGKKPFLDNPPPYIWRASFVQLVTDLTWEMPSCVLASTSETSKRKTLESIRQTTLHAINVTDDWPHEFRRSLYSNATTVVFCFSIGNESSFENVKDQVKQPRLTTHPQMTRAHQ